MEKMTKNLIELRNFFDGGLADSMFTGQQNSLVSIVGFDIHSEPGILKVAQKLTKKSGSLVDELVKCILPISNGDTYFFSSSSSKGWVKSSGVYSAIANRSPSSGDAGVLGAAEFNGILYYGMEEKLGVMTISSGWASRNDSWNTFSAKDDSFKPMFEKNIVLHIGDGKYIATVDSSGAFVADALDLDSRFRVKSLGSISDELLIGTFIADNINRGDIFRWDTYSESFNSSDETPEIGINANLPLDNISLFITGTKGNIYAFNGEYLQKYRRIPGDWSGSNKATVYPYATANYHGLGLFGVSNVSGNPCKQGVYSLGSYSQGYPIVMSMPYVISQDKVSDIEIGAVAVSGDTIFVSWKDGTTFGIDEVDTTAKYNGAYIETKVVTFSRSEEKTFTIIVPYRSLPSGTSIVIKASENYGTYRTIESVDDSLRKMQYAKVTLKSATAVQFKIETTASGNTAPEIEGLDIFFE